ncbi:MAG: 1-acyl-sn-glycerol-3-phosphate acyltransferase [Thermoleophilaceae bacterium]|nr:1-acyl-sn-glycerol-3-phosphate acyltransferase [Thermoleophilaceae bacterium]
MKRVPPLVLRRAVLAPLVVVLELALLIVSPVLLALAVVASPFFGAWRPLRMLTIVLSFVARHLGASLACLGLWLASGFGRRLPGEPMQRAHYAVLRWFVTGIYATVVRVAHVEVRVSESREAEEELSKGHRPVVVLSRHAGEGDTLLVLEHLLGRHRRRPRVVMHEALRLDPLIDVLGGRLPNRFVDPRGGDTEVEIAAMASDLEDRSAVVIFPEGGNFSERHRQKGIDRLHEAGHAEQAAWARSMRHMAAPRPGGALAAIDAAPNADIVFAGHVGFPGSLGEVWRLLPHDQTVEVRLWMAGSGEVPVGYEERIDWLFGWWRTLDAWVAERHEEASALGTAR